MKKTPRTVFSFTDFVLHTALSILSLSSLDFGLAVDWLLDPRRRGAQLSAEASRDQIQKVLEDIVLAATGDDIADWGSLETAPSKRALHWAHRVMLRHNMSKDVRLANFSFGVAPSSRCLLRKHNDRVRGLSGEGFQLQKVGLQRRHDLSSPRSYMSWLREKQRISFGKIRFGEAMTLEQKTRQGRMCF